MAIASAPALSTTSTAPNLPTVPSTSSNHSSATVFKPQFEALDPIWWGSKRDQDAKLIARRAKGQAFRVLANPNVSPGKGYKEVIMVDPLEAKRIASKQMEEIKAREKFKRRRQIEAINGAWAMIGLTAGLVIEGQTGNGILSQLAGYLSAIVHFFVK